MSYVLLGSTAKRFVPRRVNCDEPVLAQFPLPPGRLFDARADRFARSRQKGTKIPAAIRYRLSLAGNVPEEAIYFNCNQDADGHPLDGAQRYENGQLPPVSAFWSLTMYDGKEIPPTASIMSGLSDHLILPPGSASQV
jgi:hypothetical protein